ncbi:hypothetical protein CYMTET_3731 [Cymbomonas tetramitiformis]|uniref:Uncharacterized protein n=1 Tax=Cymbomonas tetramitiformis TaxID=36881 RepID=A0AAE0H2I1_9CHLO|nr:hypothetical protein CYMTET_35571 [Cymbomonas tetramitiformis]KAK3288804.1 hypothetical protein CYMTET_3731 [Cymbomonas tetramitiformis]
MPRGMETPGDIWCRLYLSSSSQYTSESACIRRSWGRIRSRISFVAHNLHVCISSLKWNSLCLPSRHIFVQGFPVL